MAIKFQAADSGAPVFGVIDPEAQLSDYFWNRNRVAGVDLDNFPKTTIAASFSDLGKHVRS